MPSELLKHIVQPLVSLIIVAAFASSLVGCDGGAAEVLIAAAETGATAAEAGAAEVAVEAAAEESVVGWSGAELAADGATASATDAGVSVAMSKSAESCASVNPTAGSSAVDTLSRAAGALKNGAEATYLLSRANDVFQSTHDRRLKAADQQQPLAGGRLYYPTVSGVVQGSPAASIDLRIGDQIVGFDRINFVKIASDTLPRIPDASTFSAAVLASTAVEADHVIFVLREGHTVAQRVRLQSAEKLGVYFSMEPSQ